MRRSRQWLNRILRFAWRPMALGSGLFVEQEAPTDDAQWIYVQYVEGLRAAAMAERDERAASEQRRSA